MTSASAANIPLPTPGAGSLDAAVLDTLAKPATPAQIAYVLGVPATRIEAALRRLANRGAVVAVEGGRWRAC